MDLTDPNQVYYLDEQSGYTYDSEGNPVSGITAGPVIGEDIPYSVAAQQGIGAVSPSLPASTTVSGGRPSGVGLLSGLSNLFGSAGRAVTSVGSAISTANSNAVFDASGRLVAIGGKPVSNYSLLGGVTGMNLGGLSWTTWLLIAVVTWLLLR